MIIYVFVLFKKNFNVTFQERWPFAGRINLSIQEIQIWFGLYQSRLSGKVKTYTYTTLKATPIPAVISIMDPWISYSPLTTRSTAI